jgi:hypothetical protein
MINPVEEWSNILVICCEISLVILSYFCGYILKLFLALIWVYRIWSISCFDI